MHQCLFSLIVLALLTLSGCGRDAPDYFQGYLEGEYVLVAPEHSGRIDRLAVADGEHVEAGAVLFRLEQKHENLLVGQAAARQAQATALLEDIGKGARPAEIRVLQAGLREAEADLKQARHDVARLEQLAVKHFVSSQKLEQARTQVVRLQAGIDRLQSELTVARLGGRADRVAAAEAEAAAAAVALSEAERQLAETIVHAPATGQVDRLIQRVGEMTGPAAPVLRFLPDGAVKLVFYVPETAVAGMQVGGAVSMQCDGCGKPRTARISRIASEAEYTPPVLFNRDNRAKLMFRLEAKLQETEGLLPGLPVEVRTRSLSDL